MRRAFNHCATATCQLEIKLPIQNTDVLKDIEAKRLFLRAQSKGAGKTTYILSARFRFIANLS
jgi:hypothetical protein